MKNSLLGYALCMTLAFCSSCAGQNKENLMTESTPEIIEHSNSEVPSAITRSMIQDKAGNIWIAAFDGVFKYDGSSFTNVTKGVSDARFFSVLEDSKGMLWFGSIGSGVYSYDGTSFQNFTEKDGLVSNAVVCIYEDKQGDIWFGANGGVSQYDGQGFRNYLLAENTMVEEGNELLSLNYAAAEKESYDPKEVNSIVEDREGKFWFGTRENAFVYNGQTFSVVNNNGESFTNVRWIIEDKGGRMWLGGKDGLWRIENGLFTLITSDFTGYIYEDRKGNIWTGSQGSDDQRWALSCYDEKTLSEEQPNATEIKSEFSLNKGIIFGILEANDGTIWFGGLDGVYVYNGISVAKLTE